MKPNLRGNRGNIAITALLGVGVVGLAWLFLARQGQKVGSMMTLVQQQRLSDSMNMRNASQLGRLKGLLNPRNTAKTTNPNATPPCNTPPCDFSGLKRVTALFPKNYFAPNWDLSTLLTDLGNKGIALIPSSGAPGDYGQIQLLGRKLDFNDPTHTSKWDNTSISTVKIINEPRLNSYAGTTGGTHWTLSRPGLIMDPSTVSGGNYYVKGLLVEITSQQPSSTCLSGSSDLACKTVPKVDRAIIPLEKPDVRNARLQILKSDGNYYDLATTGESIPVGTQHYRVLVDGAALDVQILVNGVVAPAIDHVFGPQLIDPNTHLPKSTAVDPTKTNQALVDFFYEFNPGPNGKPRTLDSSTCQFNTNITGAGNFGVSYSTAMTLSVTAFDVSNNLAPDSTTNYTVNLVDANPKPKTGTNVSYQPLIDFYAACPHACDISWINQATYPINNPHCWAYDYCNGSDPTCGVCWNPYKDEVRNEVQVTNRFPDIYFPGQLNNYSNPWVVGPYGLCENYAVAAGIVKKNGWDWSDAYGYGPQGDPNAASMAKDYIAYDLTSCQPTYVFARNACGCFTANTMIQLADGRQKPIDQLARNDIIFNPVTRSGFPLKKMVQGPEAKPLYLVTVGGDRVEVTDEHPFATQRGLINAAALKVGDALIAGPDGYRVVTAISKQSYQTQPVVWNVELEAGPDARNHYVLANGIVTGDLYLQTQLKQGEKPAVAGE